MRILTIAIACAASAPLALAGSFERPAPRFCESVPKFAIQSSDPDGALADMFFVVKRSGLKPIVNDSKMERYLLGDDLTLTRRIEVRSHSTSVKFEVEVKNNPLNRSRGEWEDHTVPPTTMPKPYWFHLSGEAAHLFARIAFNQAEAEHSAFLSTHPSGFVGYEGQYLPYGPGSGFGTATFHCVPDAADFYDTEGCVFKFPRYPEPVRVDGCRTDNDRLVPQILGPAKSAFVPE
jgi:hypothetical protein